VEFDKIYGNLDTMSVENVNNAALLEKTYLVTWQQTKQQKTLKDAISELD
jgi:hypothetical protein